MTEVRITRVSAEDGLLRDDCTEVTFQTCPKVKNAKVRYTITYVERPKRKCKCECGPAHPKYTCSHSRCTKTDDCGKFVVKVPSCVIAYKVEADFSKSYGCGCGCKSKCESKCDTEEQDEESECEDECGHRRHGCHGHRHGSCETDSGCFSGRSWEDNCKKWWGSVTVKPSAEKNLFSFTWHAGDDNVPFADAAYTEGKSNDATHSLKHAVNFSAQDSAAIAFADQPIKLAAHIENLAATEGTLEVRELDNVKAEDNAKVSTAEGRKIGEFTVPAGFDGILKINVCPKIRCGLFYYNLGATSPATDVLMHSLVASIEPARGCGDEGYAAELADKIDGLL